jgi:hypothetical protein
VFSADPWRFIFTDPFTANAKAEERAYGEREVLIVRITDACKRIAFVAVTVMVTAWQPVTATSIRPAPPKTDLPAGPAPSQILQAKALVKPPLLTSLADVPKFVEWAANSGVDDTEQVRNMLAAIRGNDGIAQALCDLASKSQLVDHSQALVVLALLGEMKNLSSGGPCLTKFIAQPLPTKGTVIDGEIIEQTALASLQAKAVDGLAFLGTQDAQDEVLRLAGAHPSRIVRAEAIAAYLWNNENSAEARAKLLEKVKPEEKIFLDRVTRVQGEKADTFNPKLEAFVKAHPELQPKLPALAPAQLKEPPKVGNPPAL